MITKDDIASGPTGQSQPAPFSSDSERTIYTNRGISEEISFRDLMLKLKDWWKYLFSKWPIIVIAAAIGGSAGLLYTFIKKEKYIAELSFIMEGQKPPAMGIYAGFVNQFGLGGAASSNDSFFSGDNFFALMKSRTMMLRLFLTPVKVDGEEITLIEYYIKVKKLREKWAKESPDLAKVRFPVNSDPTKFTLTQNSLISSFHAEITADVLFIGPRTEKEKTMVIRITSEDEMFSKTFAELVSKEVSDFYISTKTDKTQRNLAVLRHQADSVRREFNAALQGVSASLDANPNPNPSRARLAVPSKQREVDALVNQTMLIELIKNIEMTKMTLNEETPLFQIIDYPVLPLPVSRPNRLVFLVLGAMAFGMMSVICLVTQKIWINLQI